MSPSTHEELKKLIRQEMRKGKKTVEKMKKSCGEHQKAAEDYIKKNPWKAVGIAFFAGYIVGKFKR